MYLVSLKGKKEVFKFCLFVVFFSECKDVSDVSVFIDEVVVVGLEKEDI